MGDMTLEEYHRQVEKLVTDSFHMQCFRYVSTLPGGFELCHRFIADYNRRIIELFALQETDTLLSRSVAIKDVDVSLGRKMPNLIELVNPHWATDCYHCSKDRVEASPFARSATMATASMGAMELERSHAPQRWDSSQTLQQQLEESKASDRDLAMMM